MNWLILVIVLFVVLGVGGGIGYWLFLGTRPKKLIWKAKVYQLGEGIMPPIKHKGKVVADYKLTDLREYATDVVEQIIAKGGATRYWLKTLKKSVPVITADCVEKWGKDKWVSILLQGDTCTLLKAGYDKRIAQKIFRPMPADRINMIKTESEERKARIESKKDVLQAILPFVVAGLWIMGLVAIAYIMSTSAIKITELNNNAALEMGRKIETIKNLYKCKDLEGPQGEDLVRKEEPPTIPP